MPFTINCANEINSGKAFQAVTCQKPTNIFCVSNTLKYDKLVVTSGPYKFILLRLQKILTNINPNNVDFTKNTTQRFNCLSYQKVASFCHHNAITYLHINPLCNEINM